MSWFYQGFTYTFDPCQRKQNKRGLNFDYLWRTSKEVHGFAIDCVPVKGEVKHVNLIWLQFWSAWKVFKDTTDLPTFDLLRQRCSKTSCMPVFQKKVGCEDKTFVPLICRYCMKFCWSEFMLTELTSVSNVASFTLLTVPATTKKWTKIHFVCTSLPSVPAAFVPCVRTNRFVL